MMWNNYSSKFRDFAVNLLRLTQTGEQFTPQDISTNSRYLSKFEAVARLKTLRQMGLKIRKQTTYRAYGEQIFYSVTDTEIRLRELLGKMVWRKTGRRKMRNSGEEE